MRVEYATDLVFRSAATLGPLYQRLTRESVLSVKAEQIATFLGRQITPQLAQEVGSQFSTRIEGTCIKHHFGKASIKMYDKFGCVLRIETTANDVSFFKHHRKVEHRDGPPTRDLAPVKKTIYSLIDLREILLDCNRRYLAHVSALDDFSAGVRALERVTNPHRVGDKTVKGINFFEAGDSALLHALQNPRINIAGIRRRDLLPDLGMFSPNRLSRQLRRLLDLRVIKRVKGRIGTGFHAILRFLREPVNAAGMTRTYTIHWCSCLATHASGRPAVVTGGYVIRQPRKGTTDAEFFYRCDAENQDLASMANALINRHGPVCDLFDVGPVIYLEQWEVADSDRSRGLGAAVLERHLAHLQLEFPRLKTVVLQYTPAGFSQPFDMEAPDEICDEYARAVAALMSYWERRQPYLVLGRDGVPSLSMFLASPATKSSC